MLLKSLLVCGACIGISAAAPAFSPQQGGTVERFMIFGIVPAFMVKLSHEQIRWAELEASGRLALLNTAQAPADPDCCGGIPPWHVINSPAHSPKVN